MNKVDIELYSIGEIRKMLGVTPRTLRFYEQKGLLSPRRLGNRRYYSNDCIARLRLILLCKSCGMPLDDIGVFLDIIDTSASAEAQEHKLTALLEEHLAKLEEQKATLSDHIENSRSYLGELFRNNITAENNHSLQV